MAGPSVAAGVVEEEGAVAVEEGGADEGDGPAAKKKRSSVSQAMCDTGCGKEKVERSEAGEVEMSQICEYRSSAALSSHVQQISAP